MGGVSFRQLCLSLGFSNETLSVLTLVHVSAQKADEKRGLITENNQLVNHFNSARCYDFVLINVRLLLNSCGCSFIPLHVLIAEILFSNPEDN